MNKIYLSFILVRCVQSYLLAFSYRFKRLRFLLPFIKITARIDRPQRLASFPVVLGDFGWTSPVKLVGKIRQTFSGRPALDPIGRSPFLPSRNLHKVELFSAFISHLDDIPSWKCSWKFKSSQFEREKKLIRKTTGFEPTTQIVQDTVYPLDRWGFGGRRGKI